MNNRIINVAKNMIKKVISAFSNCAVIPSHMKYSDANEILENTSKKVSGTCITLNNIKFSNEYNTRCEYDLQIIIPAYNVEKYISNCLDTVIDNMQKSSYRILATVINDGSTDETPSILQSYIDRIKIRPVINKEGFYQVLELINQKNKGLSGARNTGLRNIKGRYIAFLDSDDTLPLGAVDALMTAALHNKADIVQGAWTTFGNHKNIKMIKPVCVSGYPWGKVFHSDLFRHFQFPEGYWFEDTPLSFIMYHMHHSDESTLKITIIEDNVYNYRINPDGITATAQNNEKCLDSYYITELCLEEMPAFGVGYNQQAIYDYFLRQCVMNWSRTKRMPKSVREAIFVKECVLKKRYFPQMHAEQQLKNIESCLNRRQFVRFELFMHSIS